MDNAKPLTFLEALNAMLTENPPPAQDQPILDRLRKIGVGPSLQFRRQDFTAPQLDALRQGLAAGREKVRAAEGFLALDPQRAEFGRWPSNALLLQLRGPLTNRAITAIGAKAGAIPPAKSATSAPTT